MHGQKVLPQTNSKSNQVLAKTTNLLQSIYTQSQHYLIEYKCPGSALVYKYNFTVQFKRTYIMTLKVLFQGGCIVWRGMKTLAWLLEDGCQVAKQGIDILILDRHLYKQIWYIVPFVHTLAKVCTNEFSYKFSRIFSARTLQIQVAHQHER